MEQGPDCLPPGFWDDVEVPAPRPQLQEKDVLVPQIRIYKSFSSISAPSDCSSEWFKDEATPDCPALLSSSSSLPAFYREGSEPEKHSVSDRNSSVEAGWTEPKPAQAPVVQSPQSQPLQLPVLQRLQNGRISRQCISPGCNRVYGYANFQRPTTSCLA